MGRMKRKLHKLTASWLDMPQDVVFELPRLTLIGDRQLYIENHRGVINFTEEVLRLSLSKESLRYVAVSSLFERYGRMRYLLKGLLQV